MAILTLEDEDIANVLSRFNFKYVDNPFDAEDVRDTMLLGSATDYVFSEYQTLLTGVARTITS